MVARLAARYPNKRPTDWLGAIKQAAQLFHYLVTGDKAHLLSVKEAAGVPIVSVADFLRLLGAPENPT